MNFLRGYKIASLVFRAQGVGSVADIVEFCQDICTRRPERAGPDEGFDHGGVLVGLAKIGANSPQFFR